MRADPRGPLRKVIAAERTPQANLTSLECGHIARLNATMTLARPGDQVRCFACGQANSPASTTTDGR